MATQLDPLYTTKQVAEYLSVKEHTLTTWRRDGTGPKFHRLGGGRGPIRYRKSDLEAWLDQQAAGAEDKVS